MASPVRIERKPFPNSYPITPDDFQELLAELSLIAPPGPDPIGKLLEMVAKAERGAR